MRNLFLFITLAFAFNVAAQDVEITVNNGVDREAANVGGITEFKRLFEQQVTYPARSLADGTGGTVEIGFIVMKDGTTSNMKFLQSVNPEIDAEAIRIFRLLQWKPMIYHGEAVNSPSTLKFDFNPSKYKKLCKKRGYTSLPDAYQPADTSVTVHTKPAQMPVYPQGHYALQEFLAKNIQYPRPAAMQNLQGTVILSFIVEPSGLMSNISVDKGVGGGCNEEAMRVLKMIRWQPGYNDGKAVRTKMTFPVQFNLSEAFKDNSSSEQR